MALTKSHAAITQLTASGTSTTLDVSASYEHTLYLKQSNGIGTVTTAGTALVQTRPNGSTSWYDLTTVTFSTTAAAVDPRQVALRDDVGQVQIIWTAPAGVTSPTLDAEVGTITAV